MNEIIIPDTNLLIDLSEAYSRRNRKTQYIENAQSFWKMYSKQIEIPKIVWSEFLGVWFHKDIDFETYDSWFDKRYNCFAQAFKFIKELGIGFYDEKV